MTLNSYLMKRVVKGKQLSKWQLRLPVPRALHGKLGKQIWKSMGTSDRALAERKAIPEIAKLHGEWDKLLAKEGLAMGGDLQAIAVQRGYDRMLDRLDEDRRVVSEEDYPSHLATRAADLHRLSRRQQDGDLDHWQAMADRIIAKSALDIKPNTDAYFTFVDALARVNVSALDVHNRRNMGDLDAQSTSEVVRDVKAKATAKAAAGRAILELFELYAEYRVVEGKKRLTGLKQDRMVIGLFAEFVGVKRSVGSITREEARDFRNTVAQLPPNYSKRKDYAGLSMRDAAAKATRDGEPKLSPITLARYVSTVSPFFDWLRSQHYAEIQPFDGLHQRPKKGMNPRPPFTTDGSAPWRGVGTPILGRAKDDQAASAGRLMRGLSLNAPIVSSVI